MRLLRCFLLSMSEIRLTANDIFRQASAVGFDDCGIAKAQRFAEDAQFIETWVAQGLHGEMDYLERNCDKRYDIRRLVPGAKTVVVCLLRYDQCGHDYHRTIKSKLYELEANLGITPLPTQHIFCDSAPVLERRYAVTACLGFIGKNHQFISPKFGSKVHIGELVLGQTVKMPPSDAGKQTEENECIRTWQEQCQLVCGSCTKCIDACVRGALGKSEWDVRRCLAYETHKCTMCQEVCPFNQ